MLNLQQFTMSQLSAKNILLALLLLPSLLMAGLAGMCRSHELSCELGAPSCCPAIEEAEQGDVSQHQHSPRENNEQGSQEHSHSSPHRCDHKNDPLTSEAPDRALYLLSALQALCELMTVLDWNSGQTELAPLDTEPPLARAEILSSYRPLLI